MSFSSLVNFSPLMGQTYVLGPEKTIIPVFLPVPEDGVSGVSVGLFVTTEALPDGKNDEDKK